MNENEYFEIQIAELAEVPTSDTADECHQRSSNKIHDYHNLKLLSLCNENKTRENHLDSKKSKLSKECSASFQQTTDSSRAENEPFDIGLLLRYYACCSNMEKSISKVLEEMDKKTLDSLNDQIYENVRQCPLIELGAVHIIFESLERSSSKKSPLLWLRFQNVLTQLQSLISQCDSKQLQQIICNDPSINICKYCGVISCSKSRNASIESRQSSPITSYFLNMQTFSEKASMSKNDRNLRTEAKSYIPRKERTIKRDEMDFHTSKQANQFPSNQRKTHEKDYEWKEDSCFNKKNKYDLNVPRQTETMAAERDNASRTQRACSMKNTANGKRSKLYKAQSHVPDNLWKMSQALSSAGKKLQTETIDRASIPNGVARQTKIKIGEKSNVKCELDSSSGISSLCTTFNKQQDFKKISEQLKNIRFDKYNKQGMVNQERISETSEKIINDISYVKSKSQIDVATGDTILLKASEVLRDKQYQYPDLRNDINSIIDTMTYLARGCLEPLDKKEKEFVSQFDEGAIARPRLSNNNYSFALHSSRDENPHLAKSFLICGDAKHVNEFINNKYRNFDYPSKNKPDRFDRSKYVQITRNVRKTNSISSLMEVDSLENCTKTSSTVVQLDGNSSTAFSSTTVESMIHKWVKSPQDENVHDETGKRSLHLAPSTVRSNVESLNSEINNSQRDQQINPLNQTQCHSQIEKPTYISDDDSKIPTRKTSTNTTVSRSKKSQNSWSKNFLGKHILRPFKSVMSVNFKKLKENISSGKLSKVSDNNASNDYSNFVTRKITFSESLVKNLTDDDSEHDKMTELLSIYRNILENTEKLDWQNFQRFVEILHPDQAHLWRDVCSVINSEAGKAIDRANSNAEVCIEISSIPCEGTENEKRTGSNEIVFEINMTLKGIERFLERNQASAKEEQLDTFQKSSEVTTVQNDDVCDAEVASNPAE